jgi:hypothetical protein
VGDVSEPATDREVLFLVFGLASGPKVPTSIFGERAERDQLERALRDIQHLVGRHIGMEPQIILMPPDDPAKSKARSRLKAKIAEEVER